MRIGGRAATLLLLAVLGACQQSPKKQMDSATIRLATAVLSSETLDVSVLGDRDTATAVELSSSSAITVTLDHEVDARALKVFVDGSVTLSGLGLSAETVSGSGVWVRKALPEAVRGSSFTLTLVPNGASARVGEIELWGGGRPRASKDLTVTSKLLADGSVAYENALLIPATVASATLQPIGAETGDRCMRGQFSGFAPRAVRRAYAIYEANVQRAPVLARSLNGEPPVGGFWLAAATDSRTIVDELDPEALTGSDNLQLCMPGAASAPVDVTGLRLLLLLDDGTEHWDRDTRRALGATADGDASTSVVLPAGREDLGLDRFVAVETAEAQVSEAGKPTGSVGVLEPAGWSDLAAVTWSSTTTLGFGGKTIQGAYLTFEGESGATGARVSELSVAGSGVGTRVGKARIVLTYPETKVVEGREIGERFGSRAYVSGWAESASGPGTIEIGGARVGDAGHFGTEIERPTGATGSWAAVIRARFPDGTEIARTVVFDDDREGEIDPGVASDTLSTNDRFGKENQTSWGEVDAENGGKVKLGTDVELEVPGGAVGGKTSIGITRKGAEGMPPLDAGMVNVTAPAHSAYRFLPKGQRFAKAVKVKIPYDPTVLPEGTAPEEIQTYYYDEAAAHWQPLPRVEVSRQAQRVTSETTHFTFMINAVLVLPEHPGPASFNPTSIKDLKAADPSAGIDFIEAPEANSQGTAQVSYPIRLPRARGAYQPALRLSYDSSAANGWTGFGWSLPVSSVAIDTKFGVPVYDGQERYLLDGAQLVPGGDGDATCVDGAAGRMYRARVEKEYKRVVRCGSGVTDYHWEVTDRAGTLYVYGASASTRLARPAAVGTTVIAEWYLARVIDLNGNLTAFTYDFDSKDVPTTVPDTTQPEVTHGEPFTQAYLRAITYSGVAPRSGAGALADASETGAYRVELRSERSSRNHLSRPDVVSSGRTGFKVVTRRRLASITVTVNDGGTTRGIREYQLAYEKGNYGKSRLKTIKVYGAWEGSTPAPLFYQHDLGYFDAPDTEKDAPFEDPKPLTFSDGGDENALSRAESWGFGTHTFSGIGPIAPASVRIGTRVGFNYSKSTDTFSFVDVNGDWLPDRVQVRSAGTTVAFNDGQQFSPVLPPSDPFEGRRVNNIPVTTLGTSSNTSFNVAMQAMAYGFSLTYGMSWFSSETPSFLIDADGDGLVDVLDKGTVYFNQTRSGTPLPDCVDPRKNPNTFCFLTEKWIRQIASTAPVLNVAADLSKDPEIAQTVAQIEATLHPADALVEWLAPFDGTVEISGSLSFSRAAPQWIDPAWDGVRLTMYLVTPTLADDGSATYVTEVLSEPRTIKLAALSVPTPIYVPGVSVVNGSRIYFVLTTLDGFPVVKPGPVPLEEVDFAPSIAYSFAASAGGFEPRDPTNAPIYRFNSVEDFRLAGAPLGAVTIPANGDLQIHSSVTKLPCADDVRFCIQKFGADKDVDDLRCDTQSDQFSNIWTGSLESWQSGTITGGLTVPVAVGEKLVFRVESDLAIDPAAVDWNIGGAMTCVSTEKDVPCSPPAPEDVDDYTFVADAFMPLHLPIETAIDGEKLASARPKRTAIVPFIAAEPGTLHVTNVRDFGDGTYGPTATGVIYAIRKLDGLVVQDGVTQKGNLTDLSEQVDIALQPGDHVFFEAHSETPFVFSWVTTNSSCGDGCTPIETWHQAWTPQATFEGATGNHAVVPVVNVTVDGLLRDGSQGEEYVLGIRSPFGGGFHGWRYGIWGGPNAEEIDPSLFEPKAGDSGFPDTDDQEELVDGGLDRFDSGDGSDQQRAERVQPLVPRRAGTYFGKSRPGLKPKVPAYVSRDGNVFVTQGTIHAAREGGYVEGGKEGGDGTSISARFHMGSMARASVGDTTSAGLGVIFTGLNIGAGQSRVKADVRDMNGDGIIDVVKSDKEGSVEAKLTDPRWLTQRSNFFASTYGAIQSNKDLTASFGMGVSDPVKTLSRVVGSVAAMFPDPSGGLGVNYSATDAELIDVNGDGLPDIVRRDAGSKGFQVRLNLGTSFAATEDFVPSGRWKATGNLDTLIDNIGPAIGGKSGKRMGKLLDLLKNGVYKRVVDPNMVRRTTALSINDNLGWGSGERAQATVNWESSIAATAVELVDINGDGLPDFVRKGPKDEKLQVMLNNGYGFEPERSWTMTAWPSYVASPWLRSRAWAPVMRTLLDWTVGSNPKVDSVEANGTYSIRPTIGFVYSWSIPIWVLRMHFAAGGDATLKKAAGMSLSLQDVNGDGLPDHVLKAEKLSGKENRSIYVRLNQLQKANLLKTVSRPLGGSFDLDYARTSPSVDMAGSRWVLSSVTRSDGRSRPNEQGHEIATTYSYSGGYHDRAEREFLGFERVERVQADGTRVVQRYLNTNFATRGLLAGEETQDAAGRLFVSTSNTYETPSRRLAAGVDKECVDRTPFFLDSTDYCQSFETRLRKTTRTHYEGNVAAGQKDIPVGAGVSTTQEFLDYDKYGNVTSFHDGGDAADLLDDVWARVTYATSDAASGAYSVSRPLTVEVRTAADGGGNLLRMREATYDGQGNALTFKAWYEEGKTVLTNLDWTSYGTLRKFTGPEVAKGRYSIEYEYDATTHTYPVRVTDAHGYSSTATHDLRFGEVATTVDVNGKQTRRVYDFGGRLSQLYGPRSDSTPLVTVAYDLTTAANDLTKVAQARTSNRLPEGDVIDTIVFMDGLKRVIQTQKTAEVSSAKSDDGSTQVGWSASGQLRFDAMGRVREQGLPFFVELGYGGRFVDDVPVQPTVTTYDALGRPKNITSPAEPALNNSAPRVATTRTTYDIAAPPSGGAPRLRTTVTDANEHVRASYRALADRIVAVEERIDAAILVTGYVYNPVGELTQIADAEGHLTQITNDLLGRRTRLVNPDAGQTDFVYDGMGNLVLKQDANLRKRFGSGAYIRYEYDLDQLSGIRYPQGALTMDVKFEYGPPGVREANDAGRISRVVDDGGEETRAYGALGELVRSTRTLRPLKPLESPLVFTTTFDFDEYGRMKSLTYPDGEKVTYGYDRGGLLKSATGERPATVRYPAATETYLKSMVYDEYGQRRQVQLGNGAVTKYSYYPENHRLATVATTAAGRKLQDLVYAYDLVGNVTDEVNRLGVSTTSRSGQVTYTFEYDALDRLKKSTGVADARPGVTDQFTATYGYSNIHNMTANGQVHTVTTVTDLGTDIAYPPHTNHDFTYTYGGAGPHQATQIGDTFLKYDGNGNTTSECRDHGDPTCSVNRDHFRELKWTEDNRLSSVVDGGGKSVTRFVYDAAGERLVKYGNGGASITVGQFFALKGRTAATKHIFAGTMRLASKLLPPTADWAPTSVTYTSTVATSTPSGGGPGNDNGCVPSDYQPQKCPILVDGEPVVPYPFQDTKVRPETYYYHPDHLGSTSWVTDQNGKVHEHVDYFPYGEVWREPKSDRDGAGVKGQRFLFSGKELDEETGLYYFGARYYDPVRARWASTDPLLVAVAMRRPVGLSAYAYASWSPAGRVDPTGEADSAAPATVGPASPSALRTEPWQGYTKADWATWAGAIGTKRWTEAWAYSHEGSVVAPTWGDRRTMDGQTWKLGTDRVLDKAYIESILNRKNIDQVMGMGLGGPSVTTRAGDEAFHYTFSRAISSIERQGLRAGSYATTTGSLSPLQAHIDLALSPNRGLPDALLRIDLAGLRQAGYEIPNVTQVGRSFGMPGGGFEMQFPYPIPREFITVVRP